MKYQLLLFAAMLIAFITCAQNNYLQGYIVKSSGDTVKGYIKEDNNSHLSEQVLFKAHEADNATTFTVKDIRAFGFEKNIFRALNYLDEVDSVQKDRFGKLLVEGYYNLYAIYFGVGDHYYYITSQQGKNFFLYDDLLRNTVESSRKGNFRNHLYFIGQSCPNVISNVESLSYTEKDVARFVQQVNNCVEPGKASSIQFNKSKTRLDGIYLFAGGLPLSNGQSQIIGQLLARFVSPSISRQASLNIGFSYLRSADQPVVTANTLSTEEDREVTEIYSIPIQLQYNFTSSRFQPYVFVGVSAVYKIDKQITTLSGVGINSSTYSNSKSEFGPSVLAGVGFEIYLIKHFLIKAEYRYELFLQKPAVGLAYKF